MFRDLIRLSRPKHWVKNVFSFLPVPFAVANGAQLNVVKFAYGLLCFCLASSAVYAFNDAQDAERDRMHEDKRNRPIAAGRITKPVAYVWSALLASLGGGLAFASGKPLALMLFGI